MAKKHQPSKIKRRDFLATSSIFGLGTASGLIPRVALGASDPLQIAPQDAEIHQLAIYPPLGICRVGNDDKHFLAPEIPGMSPNPTDGYKQGPSKIKKQAQKFRIYAFDDQGRVIREVVNDTNTEINWKVKMANGKAAWYEFNNPLDMGSYAPGLAGKLRNNFYLGKDREVLEIAPDEVQIKGENQNANGNDDSKSMIGDFWSEPNQVKVKLGHVQTDGDGRLIVVPGNGAGDSAMRQSPINNFADNDGWYDDWADGYVKAEVTINGESKPVESAWVSTSGPNFAPEIEPFITLYDVVRDVMINGKKDPLEEKPALPLSFREEIYPFFKRLGQMQWISAAANFREGWIDLEDFSDPKYIKTLCDPSPANKDIRMKVFNQFRNPKDYKFYNSAEDFSDKVQYKIPYMLGSGVNYDFSPAHWFTMPETQYWILQQWAEGNFVDDLKKKPKVEETGKFADIPLDQQPYALTRAALEPLSGGAFHPGVELTWPLRQQGIFRDDMPYRIKVQENAEPMWKQTEKLGLLLTPEVAFKGATRSKMPSGESYSYYGLQDDSPVSAQKPGDLTRWLGLPWHPDAFSCQAVMYANDFPNATWWPALLPIDVMPEYCFKQLEREDLDDEEKLKFFNDRQLWTRGVTGIGYHVQGSYDDGLERMVALWPHMGFVLKRKRPENLSARLKGLIPEEVYVETGRGSMDLYTNAQPNEGLPKKRE